MTKWETIIQVAKLAFAVYFAYIAWQVLHILTACDL